MAANLQEALQAAERQLKSGKIDAALLQLQRFAESEPGDLLALNRIGDLLSRHGRSDEAISYYVQIAGRFTESGFLPKATAIYKKILRLDPDRTETLVALAQLYVGQKLMQEATGYFLSAADRYLEQKNFQAAREVYENLVAADPSNTLHRARLAEALAALGENALAADEFVVLGDSLLESASPGDAHKTYQRAAELVPESVSASLGLSNCLFKLGNPDEALATLEACAKQGSDPRVVSELLIRYEESGRWSDSARLLEATDAELVSPPVLQRVFRHHLQQDTVDGAWARVDPVLERWSRESHAQHVDEILAHLADLESDGHVPALARLYQRLKTNGDQATRVQTLERLIRAHRARGETQQVEAMQEELRSITPRSSPAETAPPTESTPVVQPAPVEELPDLDSDIPIEFEAPAVPLNRTDEEFVTGRLTQTEILEKYGLEEKALAQVEEITDRFPGHAASQARRVTLLRALGKRDRLGNALVGLALACRASGEMDEARAAAREATLSGELAPDTRRMLGRLGLIAGADAGQPAANQDGPEVSEIVDETDAPVAEAAPPPAPVAAPGESGVVIDFDDFEEDAEATEAEDPVPVEVVAAVAADVAAEETPSGASARAAVETPTTPAGAREPSPDMLDEIRLYVDSGDIGAAQQRLQAMERLGFGGPQLEELGAQVARQVAAAAAIPQPSKPAEAGDDGLLGLLADQDDDLSAMTAALEEELFDEEEAPAPTSGPEQSLEDIFAAFKEHVQEQVDDKDARTHYDLGIAYKEMGLLDEAIGEFQVTMKSGELLTEAASMLAVCYRDKGHIEEAADWYRRGIENAGEDSDSAAAMAYDLAELLLSNGDSDGALKAFRDLKQTRPEYRDVDNRIAELEG